MRKKTLKVEFESNLSDGEADAVALRVAPDMWAALEKCAAGYGKSVKAVKVRDVQKGASPKRAFEVEFDSDLSDAETGDVTSSLLTAFIGRHTDVRTALEMYADSYGKIVRAVKVRENASSRRR